MTNTRYSRAKIFAAWRYAWPFWVLVPLFVLPVANFIHIEYVRTLIVAPVLLLVPGSLTIGVLFEADRRPRGATFTCCSALLGVAWFGFTSLILYVSKFLITAVSTYWCLLVVSVLLALIVQARMLRDNPALNQRVELETDDDGSDFDSVDPDKGTWHQRAGYQVPIALIAGLSLLGGAVYALDHVSSSNPDNFTWIAWTGPKPTQVLNIGSSGRNLPFEIVHHQQGETEFKLNAEWAGNSSRPLAGPLSLTLGPDQTLRGNVFIPSPATGCVYRIVVALTAVHQIDQFTKSPESWTINIDVRNPAKTADDCQ